MRDDDIKECYISYSAEDEITGSMFLTREEYEIVKRVLDKKNWSNVHETGMWTPSVDIWSPEFEEG